MTEVKLSKGYVAIIDDCDAEAVLKFKWSALKTPHTVYGMRAVKLPGEKKIYIYLHRYIAELAGMDISGKVDHRDHNGLNNRRQNLRPANNSQNAHNKSRHRTTASGYKGVYWNKNAGRWQAGICCNRKTTYLGLFHRSDEAARAYDTAAKALHGDFAQLNFPPLE